MKPFALALLAVVVGALVLYAGSQFGRSASSSRLAAPQVAMQPTTGLTVVAGSEPPMICGTPVPYLDLLLRTCDPERP